MTYAEVRSLLTRKNFLKNNYYFTKYVELVCDNITTKKIKFETAQHHVIPVFLYKKQNNSATIEEARKLANADVENFCINLSHADHLLIHYYLALAVTETYYDKACYAFNRLSTTGNSYSVNIVKPNDIVEIDLELYQQLLVDANKARSLNTAQQHKDGLHSVSEQQRKKLGESSKGRVWVANKKEEHHFIKIDELSDYLDKGFIRGKYYHKENNPHLGKKRSIETRAKISAQRKGKPIVLTPEAKKDVYSKVSMALKGREMSAETKQKLSSANKNLKNWTDGTILIRQTDCPGENFYSGYPDSYKEKRKNNKRIWYNDGVIEKLFGINENIPSSFSLGRLKKANNAEN